MQKLFAVLAAMLIALPAWAVEGDHRTQQPEDKVIGSAAAKVEVIEYASLACSHCAKFYTDILPTIKKEYIDTGKARLIYRDFPHNEPALAASVVAQCTAKQLGDTVYFSMIKTLFTEQKQWAFDAMFQTKLLKYAHDTGVDKEKLMACLTDEQTVTDILQTRKIGAELLRVETTPSFFFNGELKDIHSLEDMRAALDAALTK